MELYFSAKATISAPLPTKDEIWASHQSSGNRVTEEYNLLWVYSHDRLEDLCKDSGESEERVFYSRNLFSIQEVTQKVNALFDRFNKLKKQGNVTLSFSLSVTTYRVSELLAYDAKISKPFQDRNSKRHEVRSWARVSGLDKVRPLDFLNADVEAQPQVKSSIDALKSQLRTVTLSCLALLMDCEVPVGSETELAETVPVLA